MCAMYFDAKLDGDQLQRDINEINANLRKTLEEGRAQLIEELEKENSKLNEYVLYSDNPVLIDWWGYYKRVVSEDYSMQRMINLRLSFLIFVNYLQYKEKQGELKEFVKSKQGGYLSSWKEFSEIFLNSNDFLNSVLPQISKKNYLKYEGLTFKYLDKLYKGERPPQFKHSEIFVNVIQSDDFKFISETYFKYAHSNESGEKEDKKPIKTNSVRPVFDEEIRSDVIKNLKHLFSPEKEFENFINGKLINGKIDFSGKQAKLAGLLIQLKRDGEVNSGTHEQTYEFLKNTFTINGKDISSKQILKYLTGKAKISESNMIHL